MLINKLYKSYIDCVFTSLFFPWHSLITTETLSLRQTWPSNIAAFWILPLDKGSASTGVKQLFCKFLGQGCQFIHHIVTSNGKGMIFFFAFIERFNKCFILAPFCCSRAREHCVNCSNQSFNVRVSCTSFQAQLIPNSLRCAKQYCWTK